MVSYLIMLFLVRFAKATKAACAAFLPVANLIAAPAPSALPGTTLESVSVQLGDSSREIRTGEDAR